MDKETQTERNEMNRKPDIYWEDDEVWLCFEDRIYGPFKTEREAESTFQALTGRVSIRPLPHY